jgi:hypothetical protein
MEAVRASETAVYFNETTWRCIPETFTFKLFLEVHKKGSRKKEAMEMIKEGNDKEEEDRMKGILITNISFYNKFQRALK